VVSRSRIHALLAALVAWAGFAHAASAEVLEAAGLTFSDELGGFRLVSISGTGTQDDPLIIVEDVLTPRPGAIVVRGQVNRSAQGDVLVTPSYVSLAVVLVVRNRSGQAWAGFDLELREALDTPSTYTDGLSFDQIRSFGLPMDSDSFGVARRIAEPRDRVRFYGGFVDPGAAAQFVFYVTDPTMAPEFFSAAGTAVPDRAVASQPSPDRLAKSGAVGLSRHLGERRSSPPPGPRRRHRRGACRPRLR